MSHCQRKKLYKNLNLLYLSTISDWDSWFGEFSLLEESVDEGAGIPIKLKKSMNVVIVFKIHGWF